MTSQDRQQFWQQHIDAWQASDASGAAFCKQRDLNYAQFNYWRKKFRAEAVEKPAGFAQVTQLAAPLNDSNNELGLHLPSGISFSEINHSNLDVVLALLRQL
ncbi:TPA: IS66 family insertion sequence element accessory protein TnpB [Escherichia coli]|nr:IS66 family insertion sequence element accessory protein TnpB [Escherichia coli]HAJ0198648.1 IS66 family insertion sequence element accessory protein TnpB [Escherichia coli]